MSSENTDLDSNDVFTIRRLVVNERKKYLEMLTKLNEANQNTAMTAQHRTNLEKAIISTSDAVEKLNSLLKKFEVEEE
jgi:hypothetical protein